MPVLVNSSQKKKSMNEDWSVTHEVTRYGKDVHQNTFIVPLLCSRHKSELREYKDKDDMQFLVSKSPQSVVEKSYIQLPEIIYQDGRDKG